MELLPFVYLVMSRGYDFRFDSMADAATPTGCSRRLSLERKADARATTGQGLTSLEYQDPKAARASLSHQ